MIYCLANRYLLVGLMSGLSCSSTFLEIIEIEGDITEKIKKVQQEYASMIAE